MGVDVPHEVEIQRQVQVPVPVTRQVFVDVPTPVDQPFEQLVHSTRDVHVPVPTAMPMQPMMQPMAMPMTTMPTMGMGMPTMGMGATMPFGPWVASKHAHTLIGVRRWARTGKRSFRVLRMSGLSKVTQIPYFCVLPDCMSGLL